jgi:hypothetical protein
MSILKTSFIGVDCFVKVNELQRAAEKELGERTAQFRELEHQISGLSGLHLTSRKNRVIRMSFPASFPTSHPCCAPGEWASI